MVKELSTKYRLSKHLDRPFTAAEGAALLRFTVNDELRRIELRERTVRR